MPLRQETLLSRAPSEPCLPGGTTVPNFNNAAQQGYDLNNAPPQDEAHAQTDGERKRGEPYVKWQDIKAAVAGMNAKCCTPLARRFAEPTST